MPKTDNIYSLLLKQQIVDANRRYPTLALGVYLQNQLLLHVRRAEMYSETSQTISGIFFPVFS